MIKNLYHQLCTEMSHLWLTSSCGENPYIKALFTNPWISEHTRIITTTSQANAIYAFEVLACGNPTHNLEVVSSPKPTTITLLSVMSIFSQSRLCVCKRLPLLSWSELLSYCNMLLMSALFRRRPRHQQPLISLSVGPQLRQRRLGWHFHLHSSPRHPGCLFLSSEDFHSMHSLPVCAS